MAYLKFKKFYLVPAEEFEVENVKKSEIKSLSEDLILTNIPKKFLRDATSILSYIRGKISWSEYGSLLKVSGEDIPGSHISDLIRYVICPFGKKDPIALAEFKSQLSQLNLPSGLVNNPKVVGNRTTLNDTSVDWLAL